MNDVDKLQTKAVAIVETAVADAIAVEKLNDFFFLLGGIDTANAIATNLSAAVISNLQRVRDEKAFTVLGYTRFDAFLDEHPRSPMKYKRFNYLESVITNLGALKFDLLHGSGISMRTMKLLAAGDIEVEGNEVIVGGEERVAIGESRVLKAIVEQLVNDKRSAHDQLKKAEDKIEKQEKQIEIGEEEFNQLQRNLDAMKEGSPYDRALAQAIHAMLLLTEKIGDLPEDIKLERGRDACETLWSVMQQVRKAYGVDWNAGVSPASENGRQAAGVPSDLLERVLAEDSDFGDELEDE